MSIDKVLIRGFFLVWLLIGILVLSYGCRDKISYFIANWEERKDTKEDMSSFVGHWHIENRPGCRTFCNFRLLTYPDPNDGYRILFTDGSNTSSDNRLVSKGDNRYIIKTSAGDIQLILKDDKFYYADNHVFVRD